MAKARSFTADKDIVSQLDLISEYQSMGVRFSGEKSGRWITCHAMGREDRTPSAAIDTETGYYKDHGATGQETRHSFFEFASIYGPHQDYISAKRAYAEQVGIKIRGRKNPEKYIDIEKANPQPEALWDLYCRLRKPGVSVEALKAVDARHGRWNGIPVIVLPIVSMVGNSPSVCGRVMMPYGLDLPKIKDGEVVGYLKIKTAYESEAGIIASSEDIEALANNRDAIQCVWKLEGVPDLLTFLSHRPKELAGKVVAFTNAGGCAETPKPSILEMLTDLPFNVLGDADEAGVNGAKRWAKEAANYASETRQVHLPYEIAKNHGKDFRDFINEGHTYYDLTDLADEAEPVRKSPTPFSNFTKVFYGDVEEAEPRTQADIAAELQARVINPIMRLGHSLFVDEKKGSGEIRWLSDATKLFSWIRDELDPIDWKDRKDGLVKRTELFEHLRNNVQQFKQISTLPHYPLCDDTYYMCDHEPTGNGDYIRQLIQFFNPAEDVDQSLILALLLTPFWGEEGNEGSRPIFVITSADGRGSGKSKLAEKIGMLSGGFHDFDQFERPEEMNKRFVDPVCSGFRIVRIDNIKTNKFSSSSIEAKITQPTYQGHRLYDGQASIPNRFTWIFTVNGPSLSRDLAERAIIINIRKPPEYDDWDQRINDFIKNNRREIICDILAILAEDIDLSHFKAASRWSKWEKGILSRCCHAETLADTQAVIRSRFEEVDADGGEIEILEDFIATKLKGIKDGNAYNPEYCKVHIPSAVIAKWWKECFADGKNNRAVWAILNQFADQNQTGEGITKNPTRTYGRGYLFIRGGCQAADYNLERFMDPSGGPF